MKPEFNPFVDHVFRREAELSLEQLEAVARLHLRAPMEWGERSYDDPDLRSRMARGWQAQAAGGKLYLEALLSAEDEVVAFIWGMREEDSVEIRSLFVDGSLRRRGLARELKSRIEVWAKASGATSITTSVAVGNVGMLKLNASMGYEDLRVLQRKVLDQG